MPFVVSILCVLLTSPPAENSKPKTEKHLDLSKDKVLYCIGYAHLDTQWRWDYPTTISRFIKDTLEQNFDRFEKFPGYVFNFTGSARYEMMKEYYPELYDKLKKYIAEGRWFVSGSSVDEGDVNVPGAESVIRHVLYGNRFFKKEFGKESIDFMLPDCFGFPASMPSIWAHCGLKGFSTQKLTWGSAMGIPFKVGVWEGPDGNGVIAAFDPGPYAGGVKGRLDKNPDWVGRVNKNGEKYGVWADYHYYGVGDQGGAPQEEDVKNYLSCVDQPDSQIHLALTSSDQMYKDITEEQRARLPRYKGDLLLTEHSAGTLTSQAYMKRWNRKNEQLADAAERAAVMAQWLGGAEYPREKLYKSWVRVLGNQMHDILPGTSIPRAYTYSWNDEIVASNGFAAVLTNSIGAIARALNTKVQGVPLIVYNPLAIDRTDVVEAEIRFEGTVPEAVKVVAPDGRQVPVQILERGDDSMRLAILAHVPSVGLAVLDVRPDKAGDEGASPLKITERDLENEYYRVTVNDDGDVISIIDKKDNNRNLLEKPARLVFTHEKPKNWPAWNMDWADRQNPPIEFVKGPARIEIVERGPVRVALRIDRNARDSIIRQDIRLAAADAGRRLEFKTQIDWQSTECALKADFPLGVSDPKATYNWEVGTIKRGNNEPTKYEVPSHQWFDLTDTSGKYGVTILEDCKYGSDKPTDNELRLTLLYTPGVRKGYLDQHSQDWGLHDMTYAIYGHSGDWRDGQSEWQARRLNQPLRAFQVNSRDGELGKEFSFLSVNTAQVDARAVKLAEDNDFIIVRLQELWGKPVDAEIKFARPVAEAFEVDGQERRIGDARFADGRLAISMKPYRPRSFAVRLSPPPNSLETPTCTPVKLDFTSDIVSSDADRTDGVFGYNGCTIPAEELPSRIVSEGVTFNLGPTEDGYKNAVSCRGQVIPLPSGDFNYLYLLMTAVEDTRGNFTVAGRRQDFGVQSWTGFVGQWDNRVWDRPFEEVDYKCEGNVTGIVPGFIKRDTIAWFCTHRHQETLGNEPYKFSYLYKYALPMGAGRRELILPNNPRIRILAATLANNPNETARACAPLYDMFDDSRFVEFRHKYPPPPVPVFKDTVATAEVTTDRADAFDKLKMGPPVKTDYADKSSGNDVRFMVFDTDSMYPPHPSSGIVDGAFPRLNDGEAAANADDTQRCIWYDNEGRFYIDLKKHVSIDKINTYSRHRSDRAPQYFSLWASNADTMPFADIKHGNHDGWTLLGVVDTRQIGQGEIHGSSISAAQGKLGPYRHLLWISEDVGQGTFFTEIDVHAVEK